MVEPGLDRIAAHGLAAGMVLRVETAVEAAEPWLDRLDLAFSMFDKKYWDHVMAKRPAEVPKMPDRMVKVSQYVDVHLNNSRDPFVTLCAMIFELQKI